MPYGWAFALAGLALLVVRGYQVWRALSFRMAISTKWLSRIHIGKLLGHAEARCASSEDSMYLGIGFEWTQKHTQIAHDILRMPVTDIPSLPRWLSKTEIGREDRDTHRAAICAQGQRSRPHAARLVVDSRHGAEKGRVCRSTTRRWAVTRSSAVRPVRARLAPTRSSPPRSFTTRTTC